MKRNDAKPGVVIYESKAGKAMRAVCEPHREECVHAWWSNGGGRHMAFLSCRLFAYDPLATRDDQHPERCPYTGGGEAT
jgi:hypothetical protein